MVGHTCNPRCLGGRGRRIRVPDEGRAKLLKPYLKKKQNKKPEGLGA
jgi:hypothetical protein